MSRGTTTSALRCLAVWLAVTVTTALGLWQASSPLFRLREGPALTFDALLVQASAAGFVVALAWLWVVTTVTVAGLLLGWRPRANPGHTRRLVLVLCGAALGAGMLSPASATGGGAGDQLAGLALPDRASVPAQTRDGAPTGPAIPTPTATPTQAAPAPRTTPTRRTAPTPRTGPKPVPAARPAGQRVADDSTHHVVRPGDSLWSIAAGAGVPAADVDARWRAIWDANRELIGDDPDLIHPGQRLVIPAPREEGR